MAKLIEVEERDLKFIFGKNKPYSLDVYQRDYRWSDEKDYKIVTQLIKDLELRFENNLKHNQRNKKADLKDILSDVETNFKSYFLNTIMLNEQEGNIYIVDGQQRLTTVLLILIKLFHIGEDKEGTLNVNKLLGEKIYEEDLTGEKHFKISNEDRNTIIKMIFEKTEIKNSDIKNISQKNLKGNYEIISKYFDKYFYDEKNNFEPIKYNYYVYNLLLKVLIIEQVIKNKEDVAMIFETANDRGKELEPHEVLKGMLLGVLGTKKKEKCNEIWNDALNTFFSKYRTYEKVDEFFRFYFRAKYSDNKTQYDSFSGKYHRNLLSNDEIIKDLDRNEPDKIELFIKKEFTYFYQIYLQIWELAYNDNDLYVAANYANEQGQQFLLILSALNFQDSQEKEKISLVAKKLDQFYTIARLTGIYESNAHQRVIYEINSAIRGKSIIEIETIFNRIAVSYFNEKSIKISNFNEIFQYKYFEKSKIDGRFTKYILARVDRYLSSILNENSHATENSLHFITHSGTKPVNGFHTEHMFAHNEKIMSQFKDKNDEFDEKQFHDERNRLGALLLLKGNENIRSQNWIYKDKFKSYSNSGFIWNRILTNSINISSIRSADNTITDNFKNYEPNLEGLLEKSVIDERQRLLFLVIKELYKN